VTPGHASLRQWELNRPAVGGGDVGGQAGLVGVARVLQAQGRFDVLLNAIEQVRHLRVERVMRDIAAVRQDGGHFGVVRLSPEQR